MQPLRFQGQYVDQETGLHYNRFRYFDSDVGMFISRDPIGLEGGKNTFQYAPNPVMWIDPFGLAPNPATATHVTYRGFKNGKPYIGYASMEGCRSANEVILERYKNGFTKEGLDDIPVPMYVGYGTNGKYTARGLEQKYFEHYEGGKNTKRNRLIPSKTSNQKNPVGSGHGLRKEYLHSAGKHLKEREDCMCNSIRKDSTPDC